MQPTIASTSKKALTFVFIVILIDTIGLGVIIPVTPPLVMQLTSEGPSAAARYGGLLLFVYALMQMLCAPLMGALSDRYGRRPVLLASLGAFAVDYALTGLAPTISWLFVGRLVAGLTGASTTTAGAYIADVSPPERRAQNYGLIGAAFGLGFVIGPVIGGLLGTIGPRLPFFAAAGLAAANLIFGHLVLNETLAPENRRLFSWRRANPLGALLQVGKYPVIFAMLVPTAIFQLAHHANPSTWSFFTIEKFGWSQKQLGLSVGFIGVTIAVAQGLLSRRLIPKIGARRLIAIAVGASIAGYLGFALSPRDWLLYGFMLPWALGTLVGPALIGIMSNQVPRNAQGELQGVIAAIASGTAIVGPPLMTQLFAHFTADRAAATYFPGAPFVAAALLVGLGGLTFWRARARLPLAARVAVKPVMTVPEERSVS